MKNGFPRQKKDVHCETEKIIVTAAVNEQICFIIKQKGWNIKKYSFSFCGKNCNRLVSLRVSLNFEQFSHLVLV